MRSAIVCLMLFMAAPCAAGELIRVPYSCRILGKLHGIDVPRTATVEEARAGLAQAEQRADANLPGVAFCLNASRRAITRAEARQ